MKKLLAVLLSILMMISAVSVLVACGGGSDGGGSDPAAIWEDDETQEYKIKFNMLYNSSKLPEDIKSVETELSKILKKKINATIELNPILISEYSNKMNGILAANIDFDVCFTSPNLNPYPTAVARECFREIPVEAFQKYAPKTYAKFDEQIWNQAKINGKLYASINEQILPRTMCVAFHPNAKEESYQKFLAYAKEMHPDVLSKYTIDDATSKNRVTVVEKDGLKYDFDAIFEHFVEDIGKLDKTYEFIDEYLTFLEKNKMGFGEDGVPALAGLTADLVTEMVFKFDPLTKNSYAVGVVDPKNPKKVINQFDTPEFKLHIDKTYEWKEKGWIGGPNPSGKADLCSYANWKPSGIAEGKIFKTGSPVYLSNYITGTMNAISASSKNPARALKFIELMGTDKEVHNLLMYGVEGKSYELEKGNPNRISKLLPTGGYNNLNAGWALGSDYISLLLPGQKDDVWEETEKINKETPLSSVIGFVPDLTNFSISQKITDCTAIAREYAVGLCNGGYIDKDAKMTEFLQKLEKAGAKEVIAELQKQLDAFYAA